MNSKRSAVAALALVIGATALASSEAWARDPDKEIPVEPAVLLHDPGPVSAPTHQVVIPAEPSRTGMEAAQAGASALGGAGVACGVMWLYRRRGRLAG